MLNRQIVIVAVVGLFSSVQAETIYVDDDAPGGDGLSWDTAYRFLQDALAFAADRGNEITEIRVAQGTYRPGSTCCQVSDGPGCDTPDCEDAVCLLQPSCCDDTWDELCVLLAEVLCGGLCGDPSSTFQLVNDVALVGGYAGFSAPNPDERDIQAYETILSGDLLSFTFSYHLITAIGVNDSTILDGFTVTAGQALGSCCFNDRGGGMYMSSSSATVVACRIKANIASNVAGALWLSNSSPMFINCEFEDNALLGGNAGAAIHNVSSSDLTLVDCVFHNNVLGTNSTGGGAIFVGGFGGVSTVTAVGCVFTGNNGSSGGAILNNGISTFTNCLFAGNSALGGGFGSMSGHGGAIANIGKLAVTNCTIFANSAALSGAGLYTGRDSLNSPLESLMVVANSILWENTAAQDAESDQVDVSNSTLEIDYSCVQGLTGELGGIGNIGADPLFVDREADDLGLTPGSPCIDAGDNTAVPEDITTDLDGNPRFVDDPDTRDSGNGDPPIVDMGAYEFQLTCPWDCDGNNDGIVSVTDLLALLAQYDPQSPLNCTGGSCDYDNSGCVDVVDLLKLLAHYDPAGVGCP